MPLWKIERRIFVQEIAMHNKNLKVHHASRMQTDSRHSSQNNSTTRTSKNDAEVTTEKEEISFRKLPDGTLLEMIENPNDAKKSVLAASTNGQVQCAKKFKFGNKVFLPLPRDTSIVRHVRLATGFESLESAQDLRSHIMKFIQLTVELSMEQLILLSAFIIATWLIEELPVAPCVAFIGPPGSGKTKALRMLNLVCRRSLLTTDITPSALYEICDQMTPTLLIDETATVDNPRQLLHISRSGTSHGIVAVRKNGTYKLYGARGFSWLKLPNDAALNSRCVHIFMTSCTRTDLLPLSDPRVMRMAEMLQRKLLRFRHAYFQTAIQSQIVGDVQLQPRTLDLFHALAMPFGQDKEMRTLLALSLQEQESLRDLLTVDQIAVLELLYKFIHAYPATDSISIAALTQGVNLALRATGELGNCSNRKIGSLLTSLSLTQRIRTNDGYIFRLDRNTRKEIHSMALKFKIIEGPTPNMAETCQFCYGQSLGLASGSTSAPIQEKTTAEAAGRSEHCEHGERGNRGRRKKSARSSLTGKRIASPRRKLRK
jgi:hypothetical protein